MEFVYSIKLFLLVEKLLFVVIKETVITNKKKVMFGGLINIVDGLWDDYKLSRYHTIFE